MVNEPDVLEDIDVEPEPSAEVIDAREWFDEDVSDTPMVSLDILDILVACLKDMKKIRTPRAFKAFAQLTSVLQYVKLRAHYHKNPRCNRPCLNASLAIARRVGKDQYHARQIRRNERYLVQHGRLPPSKREQCRRQYTLLDNETVLLGVQKYLAAQCLGAITPRELCQHVNKIICPALGLMGKDATISERTAITWLHKLGYSFTEVRKGLYFDGHKRPDVVDARNKFLAQMQQYER